MIRMILSFFTFLILVIPTIQAQNHPPPPVAEETLVKEVFVVVEEMPVFPGCEEVEDRRKRSNCSDKKFLQYLYKEIEYPAEAAAQNITGTVVLQFIVLKDGTVSDVKVLRDIGGGCGQAAKKVIESLNEKGTKFIPGKQRGVAVNVRLNQAIKFKPAMKQNAQGKTKSTKKKNG